MTWLICDVLFQCELQCCTALTLFLPFLLFLIGHSFSHKSGLAVFVARTICRIRFFGRVEGSEGGGDEHLLVFHDSLVWSDLAVLHCIHVSV